MSNSNLKQADRVLDYMIGEGSITQIDALRELSVMRLMAEDAADTEFYAAYKLKHEVGIDVDELGDMWRIKERYVEGGDTRG